MVYLVSFFLSLAWADTCKFGTIEFDFTADPDLNRSLAVKGGAKSPLPRVADYPVNLTQAQDGKGSLCRNAAVYPVNPGKVAILFESIDADTQTTFVTVYDFTGKAFTTPLALGRSGLATQKTEKGFAFVHDPGLGERDGLTKGVGPAEGLDMVWIQSDIWKRAELGAKGLEAKIDRELTWTNSRWAKYITSKSEFEKLFRLGDPQAAEKVSVFSGFSREARKDCIQVEYSNQRRAYCRPVTSSNL